MNAEFEVTQNLIEQNWPLTQVYKAYFALNKLTNEEMKFVFDAALFWAFMYIIYGDFQTNLFLAKAKPEPDFRYFSKS